MHRKVEGQKVEVSGENSFEKKIQPFFGVFEKPHFLNPMHKKNYLIVKNKKDA